MNKQGCHLIIRVGHQGVFPQHNCYKHRAIGKTEASGKEHPSKIWPQNPARQPEVEKNKEVGEIAEIK